MKMTDCVAMQAARDQGQVAPPINVNENIWHINVLMYKQCRRRATKGKWREQIKQLLKYSSSENSTNLKSS